VTIANIIVIVLAVTLGFLLLAYASPIRYQVKVVRKLPVPPERVWRYLSEPERFPHWFPNISDCTTNGDVKSGVGQRRHVRLERKRRLGEREEEATRWEENRILILEHLWERMEGKPVHWVEARSEYRLDPEDGGTRLTTSFWFSGDGTMGRIFSLLSYRKKHEREHRLALSNLEKRLVEETYPS
jgi:uncharacterized protein YndB with AHSA1/START domain